MRASKIVGRAVAAAILLAVTPASLAAQDPTPSTGIFKTGQEVYDLCTSDDEAEVELCDWFIMASHDMIKFYGDTGTGGDQICLPMGTKALDLRNALIDYWQSGAVSLEYSAVSGIYIALTELYPC